MKKWIKLSQTLLTTHVCSLLAPGADPGDKKLSSAEGYTTTDRAQ